MAWAFVCAAKTPPEHAAAVCTFAAPSAAAQALRARSSQRQLVGLQNRRQDRADDRGDQGAQHDRQRRYQERHQALDRAAGLAVEDLGDLEQRSPGTRPPSCDRTASPADGCALDGTILRFVTFR